MIHSHRALQVVLVALFLALCTTQLVQSGHSVSTTSAGLSVSVHFIDVGQGDSIFIDTPQEDVLIDGGPADAGTTVVNYLTGLGITHIHLMIATHPHEDHIGGLIAVLRSTITVDEILLNNQSYVSDDYTTFKNLARSHTEILAERNQVFVLSEPINLTVLNPVQPLEFADVNENSIVIKLQVRSVSFLFAGDAQAEAEQSMINAHLNLDSNVLKVGHHGSSTSTMQQLLSSVSPSYAVISAGLNNRYHHPAQVTIDRLLAQGVTVYGTYRSGTIVASTDGTSIAFEDSPEPIPEFSFGTMILAFMAVMPLIIMVHCRKWSIFGG